MEYCMEWAYINCSNIGLMVILPPFLCSGREEGLFYIYLICKESLNSFMVNSMFSSLSSPNGWLL